MTMRTPSTHRRAAGRALKATAAAGLLLALSGCAKDTPQNTFKPEGPYSETTYDLIIPVFIAAGVVFVFVNAMTLYSVIRFRRRSDDERPVQQHGKTSVEIGGLAASAVLLIFVGVFTIPKVFELDEKPKDALQVEVVGHQWWWEYNYREGDKVVARTANELHIPTGRKVQLNMTSGDVIHSFWPPKLAGKIDVIPGRTNHMVIQADKEDFYYGQCAEYCGFSHANMRLRVVAESPAKFDRWLAANSADTPSKVFEPVTSANTQTASEEQKGATLFLTKGCSGCHAVNGIARGAVGPNLTYFNGRATFAGAIFENTDDNLRAWLRDPPAEKPGSLMPNLKLSEEEITSLIAYLRTLGDAQLRAIPVPAGEAAGVTP